MTCYVKQRRRRRQREQSKLAKHHVCTWITLFCSGTSIWLLQKLEAYPCEKNWFWAIRTDSGERKRSPRHAAFVCRRENFTSLGSTVTSSLVLAHAPGTIYSQTDQNFGRWIQNNSILKFAYWQLKFCIVLTFHFLVFFYCRIKMRYSQVTIKTLCSILKLAYWQVKFSLETSCLSNRFQTL